METRRVRYRWIRNLGLMTSVLGLAALSPTFGSGEGHGQHGRKAENWGPVEKMHLYLCAFHVAKENPKFQLIAHHYCAPQKGDVHQCVIYDSRGANSKLLGVEYIISDETYRSLTENERKYWHPHAYEIISGQLVAPDLPNDGDDIFPGLITTWGKTWHTWPDPKTNVPIGEPLLMWSINGDGQIDESLVSARDAEFGISTSEIRKRRNGFGFRIPSIPPPKSIQEVGRQWTESGPDVPTKLDGAGK